MEVGLDGVAKPLSVAGIDYVHSGWRAGYFWIFGEPGADADSYPEQRADGICTGAVDVGGVARAGQCVYYRDQCGHFDPFASVLALCVV